MTKSSMTRKSQKRVEEKKQKRLEKKKGLHVLIQKKGLSSRQSEKLSLEEATNQKFHAVAQSLDTVWKNQVGLQEAHKRIDDQFAVLTRLTVSALNELHLRISGPDAEPISYEIINGLFEEWGKFKTRPDFRSHMQVWMMGGDLDSLPPPPTEETTKPVEDPTLSKEPTEFGGDYAENQTSCESPDSEGEPVCKCGEEDSVPEGQDADGKYGKRAAMSDLQGNLPEPDPLSPTA